MESKSCLAFAVVGGSHCPWHVFKVAFRFVLFEQFLNFNSGSCHINNFTFPAMASIRLLCLVRVRLPAHARASWWCQRGGSHNSDSERWPTSPCGMHTSNNHLPRRRAAADGQTCISQTSTVSADITYDTGLALPVTAGLLPDFLKCQWRVPNAPGKTSKLYHMSYRTSLYRMRRRTVLSYVSADITVWYRIIPM